jgi:catalase
MPATDWQEKVDPEEAARFERYAEELHVLQRRRAHGGPALRGLHAKAQHGLEAAFTVLPDLPDHAKVALFADPATYPAYVRFSNGSGAVQSDKAPDVRGVAIKVIGVAGKKIIPGMEDAATQDFLMIRTPVTPFRNADEFVEVLLATMSPASGLFRVAAKYGVGRTFSILSKAMGNLRKPTVSLATTRYFSAAPIQFGSYAVRYGLVPHAKPEPRSSGPRSDDYLRDDLSARLRQGPIHYDFQVQFFVDETRTPIEDHSVEWKEADAPFVTLARLTLSKQDPDSPRGGKVAEFVEKLSFDPWHAVKELRPLGNMMRARNVAYRVSTQERGVSPEPNRPAHFD